MARAVMVIPTRGPDGGIAEEMIRGGRIGEGIIEAIRFLSATCSFIVELREAARHS